MDRRADSSRGSMSVAAVSNALRCWVKAKLPASHWVEGVLVALPLWLIAFKYSDYVPFWDAAVYYGCVVDGAQKSLSPLAFNCAGHPTTGYLWIPGLLDRALGSSYCGILVYNLALALLALVALADLVKRLFPGPKRLGERLLVLGAFAYCPVVTSSILQLTPDFGVLVFIICLVRSLVRRHWWRGICWGVMASLSKESGVMLFALCLAAYVVTHVTRGPGDLKSKLQAMRRCAPIIVLPTVGMLVVAGLFVTRGIRSSWASGDSSGVFRQFISVSFLDNSFPASLSSIFELNFMWVPTLAILAYSVRQLLRVAFSTGEPVERDSLWEFVALLFAVSVFFLTRYRTFLNVRYYLPVYPWLFLFAARGLAELGVMLRLREAFWTITLSLMIIGNWTSIDAWSARRYGTFRFGSHPMYKITSLTDECCGYGRDQVIYNLQIAELHYLLNKALPIALGDPDAILGINSVADWLIIDSVDRTTFKRHLPGPGTFKPAFTTASEVRHLLRKPPMVNYVAMANMKEDEELQAWSAWYDVVSKQVVSRGGYEMSVVKLQLR